MPPQEDNSGGEPAVEPAPESNGASRFSEEDMDTEIEVTLDENGEDKQKIKKKKKSKEDGTEDKRETSEERKEKKRRMREQKKKAEDADIDDGIDPPPYPESERSASPKMKANKKRTVKNKMKNLLDDPLYFAAGIVICVVLPFGIYACDVILSVNVIDHEEYKQAIIIPANNFSIPTPKQLTGETYHIPQSMLWTIQINSDNAREGKAKKRLSRAISDEGPNIVETASDPTPAVTGLDDSKMLSTEIQSTVQDLKPDQANSKSTTTTTSTSTVSTTSLPPSPSASSEPKNIPKPASTDEKEAENNESSNDDEIGAPDPKLGVNETVSTPRKPSNKTRKPAKFVPRPGLRLFTLRPTPATDRPANVTVNFTLYTKQDGEFCEGLQYFYDLHFTYYNETGSDWFDDQVYSAYQKEQTMFFLFTIIGFISLLIGLGLRCDVFLSDEWSSFILVNLFLYSISMAVTVAIFAQESGQDGLRCATCRFTSYCDDIDPWNTESHWPAYEHNVQWATVALVSFILKLVDCYAIGIVTLKFIVDVAEDLWWVTCLKVFGWLFAFPMLIFTPMLGVTRFLALPVLAPNDVVSHLVVEVLFYVGAVFWGLFIIVLPCFCKMRMCSGSEEEERQEEEEMYE